MVKEGSDTSIWPQPKEEFVQKYTSLGYWGTKTIYDCFEESCRKFPNKLAVADSRGKTLTYSELDTMATKLAKAFVNAGIGKGDAVAVQTTNRAETVAVYCALVRIGAIVSPVLLMFRQREVSYILNLTESKAYFIPTEFRDFDYTAMAQKLLPEVPSLRRVIVLGEKVPEGMVSFEDFLESGQGVDEKELERNKPQANDVAGIIFTSGTEAMPKAVMHTHNTFLYSERGRAVGNGLTADDILIMASPLAHAIGFLCTTCCLITGMTLVLQERFRIEEFVKLIQERKCTWTMASAPFLYDLVNFPDLDKYDASSFRLFSCAGAPIPRQLIRQAREVGFRVAATYGTTEYPPHNIVPPDASLEKEFTTDGKPVPGTEVKVVDENRKPLPRGAEGEETSRGPGLALGYFKDPERTKKFWDEEGWYYSGDLCVMDEDDYVTIVGRIKDMIIRGGENISPKEIEDVLIEHAKVKEAAVVGMPDERLGERTCAYMVMKKSGDSIDLDEMRPFLENKELAKYKWPEKIIVVDELPKTPSGKVQKFVLREDVLKR